ncbi:polyphosphate polymerase domain-containing protein [Patescibacteria group bacterium]|nr:polyphosphate polymerase domain-containing protein [Patescibacteria group bacterium]MBU1682864.1 polyphosphate polymerase domain-containing protein [Patescibacteria group bacterium]MBU1934722.1 polyphosphate polymerase domain-containing protein [Patescibacteria group bacterium]
MHIIKHFNRFELKYILPFKSVPALKKDILSYALPDSYGDGDGRYMLSSLYYDSPDHRFYWEKVDGLKYRRKLRIRWYETSEPLIDDSQVFLEIKQRIDRVTQKKRIPLSYKDALLFCDSGIIPKYDPEDEEALQEMESLLRLYNLRPTAITTYQRQAFVGTHYDMGFRLTFDTYVTYRQRNLDLGESGYDGFIVPPDFVIMEIKTNERVPRWIADLVAKHQLQLIRVSKYCTGLDRAATLTMN